MSGIASRLAAFAALLAAAWLALALGLSPVGGALAAAPAPDLLYCVVALWAVRRPAEAPAALAFALGLARDLLSGGAVGAGALGLMLACEALRGQAPALARRGFAVEWGAVSAWGAVALALPWALSAVTLGPVPPLWTVGAAALATALAYPPVALALRWALRIGPRPAAAEGAPLPGRRP